MATKMIDLDDQRAIYKVGLDELRERDKNARYMSKATFEQLVENIKGDEGLESLPLCVRKVNKSGNEEFNIISEHHRTRAARAAGIQEIYILVYTKELSEGHIAAKQLAHNAIQGLDNEQILKEIYESITDLELRLQSGLVIEQLESDYKNIAFDQMELKFDYELLNVLFIGKNKTDFSDAIEKIMAKEILVETLDNFTLFKEAINKVREDMNIKNIAGAMGEMARIILEHYKDIESE